MWCGYHQNHHRFYCTNIEMKSVFLVFKLTKKHSFWLHVYGCGVCTRYIKKRRVRVDLWFPLVCSFIYFIKTAKKKKSVLPTQYGATYSFLIVTTRVSLTRNALQSTSLMKYIISFNGLLIVYYDSSKKE